MFRICINLKIVNLNFHYNLFFLNKKNILKIIQHVVLYITNIIYFFSVMKVGDVIIVGKEINENKINWGLYGCSSNLFEQFNIFLKLCLHPLLLKYLSYYFFHLFVNVT